MHFVTVLTYCIKVQGLWQVSCVMLYLLCFKEMDDIKVNPYVPIINMIILEICPAPEYNTPWHARTVVLSSPWQINYKLTETLSQIVMI